MAEEQSQYDRQISAHQDIVSLWDRYKELRTQLVTLQADFADLERDFESTAKRICELYKISDAGLNGALPLAGDQH